MEKEYMKDMKSNYLVLKGEGCEGSYKSKMLTEYMIPGLLRTEIRSIDNIELFYYDITDLKTVEVLWKDRIFRYSEVMSLLGGIFQTIDNSREYFLEQDDFILHPEYLYQKESTESLQLCYFPGYGKNIVNQLSGLFEFIMNKADYKEEPLVLLIYALYKESREKNTTLYKLKDILKTYDRQEIKIKKLFPPQDIKEHESEMAEGRKETQKGNKTGRGNETERENKAGRGKEAEGRKETQKNEKINRQAVDTKKESSTFVKANLLRKEAISRFRVDRNKPKTYKGKEDRIRTDNIEPEVNLPGEYEKQEEVSYYEVQTYIMGGAVAAVGIGVLIVLYENGVLSDQMGEPDYIKIMAGIAVMVFLTGYAFSKLFDPKMKSTRMVTKVVYDEKEDMEENSFREDGIFYGENTNRTADGCGTGYGIEERAIKERAIKERIIEERTIKKKSIEEKDLELEEIMETGEYATQILTEDNKTEILYTQFPEPCYCLVAKSKEASSDILIKSFPYYIGKDKNRNQLILKENSVSRFHGVLTMKEGEVFLTDIGSTNGTYVNGQKLEHNQPVPVNNSDELAFSREVYLFKVKEF